MIVGAFIENDFSAEHLRNFGVAALNKVVQNDFRPTQNVTITAEQ